MFITLQNFAFQETGGLTQRVDTPPPLTLLYAFIVIMSCARRKVAALVLHLKVKQWLVWRHCHLQPSLLSLPQDPHTCHLPFNSLHSTDLTFCVLTASLSLDAKCFRICRHLNATHNLSHVIILNISIFFDVCFMPFFHFTNLVSKVLFQVL
jgi:hypothetical protein